MKDVRNLDYQELLGFQETALQTWKEKLRPTIYEEVSRYVRSCNLAAGVEGKHRVYRGQDIVAIILTWPKPPDCYVQPTDPSEVL